MMESVRIKVVDTELILAGMYSTDTCTKIEMPTFRTGLNIGRTGHVLDISADFWCTGWY